ncbi:hypothetical protein [Jonesia quinghaiensis]|uniref:hypothetical protein n=1 Tax=Jonesia quinghaiensis TaxID=262806 RepID=UPI000407F1B7|nr:hypothetical protein [Jonesia quinghaiensis]
MTGQLPVPYADYTLEPVRALLGALHRTATGIEQSVTRLHDHWPTLSSSFSGTLLTSVPSTPTITEKTTPATELVAVMRDVWDTLDTYADDAHTPLENLRRLRDEAATLQSQRPRDVMVAPGTPDQEVWAAQAGYSNPVCLPESPFDTWNRQRDELKAEIATWVQAYENVAQQCVATLRRINSPVAMGVWDAWTPSEAPYDRPMFDTDRMHWEHKDNKRREETYSFEISRSTPGDDDSTKTAETTSSTQAKESTTFGINTVGLNTSQSWFRGHQDAASGIFGSQDGVHGSGNASYQAGLMADTGAGINGDGANITASAYAQAQAGVRADVDGSVEYGVLHAGGSASASVGAVAAAKAGVTAGKDGVSAELGVDAMVGGEASAELAGGISGVSAGVGVTGYVGAGFGANLDADITLDRVAVDLDLGVALGIGAGVNVSFDIDPKEVITDIGNAFDPRGWF